MKVHYSTVFAILFISSSLFAQNAKVTGKVTEESGEPLISANVVIDAAKGYAAVTDFDGNYEIDLPPAAYEVSYRYIGKEEIKLKITLTPGEKRILNVTLKEKQKLIDEIVVTGSKYEKKLGEETVSMDVIKGSMLTEQNIVSLDDGIAKVPSVTIADGQVNIRGGAGWSYGAGSRVQVLVDDLPLLTGDANDAKWSIVPMENVDQVEVIKGAASALYGSGALDGIINVRTAYPTDEPYAKVTLYTGAYQNPTRTPDMAWWGGNTPLGEGGNFAYRQKFGQNDLVLGGAIDMTSGYLDSSDSHQVRGNINYRHRFKNVPGLNIGINVSGTYDWGKTFFFWNGLDSMGYKPFPNTITIYKDSRFTVDPFVDYYDKKDNHIKFLGRFFDAANTNSTGQGSVPISYYGELQYMKKLEFKSLEMHIVAGTVSRYDDVNPPKAASNSLFGKNDEYNFSAYGQMDLKILSKLTISVGARWEYFRMWHYVPDTNATTGAVSQHLDTVQNSLKQLPYPLFRIGLNYEAAKATYIRASFGQGFRYPSIAERYITTTVGAIYIASNPNLDPEKGYNAELGVKQGFKLGSNWAGYADLSGFWSQYDNMMEFTFGQYGPHAYWSGLPALQHDFGLGFSSQNIGKARIIGSELDIAGQGNIGPVKVELLAGYTYIDPRSLNWNDSLALYNYQGYKLGNGYGTNDASVLRGAYNNPDTVKYLTYAQTSSSTSNLLKYRSRHTFKFDLTLTWKGIEWNTNLQYNSYQENIDYAFISPLITSLYPGAFGGLKEYRVERENIPIGQGRGDIIWNMHIGYNFPAGVRVAFLVKNLLNSEYTPRPAYFADPRNYTVQLSYTFRGKKKEKKTS